MTRLLLSTLLALTGLCLAQEETKPERLDRLRNNLFCDGELRFGAAKADQARAIFLKTPHYWTLKTSEVSTGKLLKELKGLELPFDTEVKAVGDASIKLDNDGQRMVLSRLGYSEMRHRVYHGWGYSSRAKVKLENVKGKVWLQAEYSWGKQSSAPLSGTRDWTELSADFVLDRDTNQISAISIIFEGSGTVWVDDFQLKMREPDAFAWWQSWNAAPPTAKLSENSSLDEKSGVLSLPPPSLPLDKFGGLKELKSDKGATGFFRVEKIKGKWWLITPEGHAFFKTAMFEPSYVMYADKDAVLEAVGGRGQWALQTWKRIVSWGFNSIEWGPSYFMQSSRDKGKKPPELTGADMPYTANTRFELCTDPERNGGITVPKVDWGWKSFPDVFSEQFAKAVENYASGEKRSHFRPNPQDPYLIGYLLADEPPWYGPGVWYGSLTDGFHGLPEHFAGKKKWMEFIKERYASEINKLDHAWEAKFASWDEFFKARSLPRNAVSVQDRRDFMGLIAERWYGLVAEQIKKYDPNHMIMGGNATRLYPAVFAAESKYAQVLCASLYNLNGLYRPNPDFRFYINEQVAEWTQKPIMLGYCSAQSDAGGFPGNPSVENGKLRGQHYAAFMQQAASNDNVVGLFWWMYQGWQEPTTEGYQKNWGMVTPDNRAYLELLPFVQRTNLNAYHYRLGQAPAEPEPPSQWSPTSGALVAETVTFQLRSLPYPVDKYELGVARAETPEQLEVLALSAKNGLFQLEKKLTPGRYVWLSRSTLGNKTSPWSQPFVFQVASPQEAADLASATKAVNQASVWKMTVINDEGQDVQVSLKQNVPGAAGTVPLAVEVPEGAQAKKIVLTCQLPQSITLKQGLQYSFKAKMKTDTEAAALPNLSIKFAGGYSLATDQYPIDKGFLRQRELSGGKPTLLRYSLRMPRDFAATSLQLTLSACRGQVQIYDLELVPELEYDVGLSLVDDFDSIVQEFKASQKK